jgi:hypothetical protein
MLVDSPRSPVADLSLPVTPLSSRASLYAAFLRSEPVRAIMTRKAGLTPATPLTVETAGSGVTQGTQVKSGALAPEGSRVVIISAQESLPIINFKTQAPTAAEAVRLANAATESAREYIKDLQSQQAVEVPNRIDLRPIGPPLGSQVTSGPDFVMVWIVAGILIAAAWGLVLLIDRAISRLRAQAQERRALGVPS